jgi:hypothetical protein
MIKENNSKTHCKQRNRLHLTYSKREWVIINDRITASGNKNGVISHIIKEAKSLDVLSDELENKKDLPNLEKKQFYPPDHTFESIKRLSQLLGIKPSTLVSRFIISPLLTK